MDAERWRAVRKLLDGALDREGEERAAFLDTIEDAGLRADVVRLLGKHEETTPLDRPVVDLVMPAMANDSGVRDWDREQIGRRIGAFELDELLGSGGMGTVYLAHRVDGRFEQKVAIKLVLTAHAGLRDRFRKEQEILAGLRHPNIAQLIDGGEADDGTPYLAMEYVDGVSITDYCRDHLPDVEGRLRLMLRVAGALAHAHRNLVIHRDIKPSNIIVSHDGHPKLLDFGIAKLVGEERFRPVTAQRIGPMTPQYAAPEQFRGQPITVATDIYQFGVLLFRIITGRLPYDANPDDAHAWGRAVVEDDPVTLGRALAQVRRGQDAPTTRDAVRTLGRELDRDLDAIVRTALAKETNARYGSIDAFVADLGAFLDGRPVQARHGGTLYHATRFIRRHRIAVAVATLTVTGLLGLSVYALQQSRQARVESERARAAVAFVHEVFRAADPANGRGGARSAVDVLESAARQIEPTLKQQPDLRGPIAVVMAGAFFNLGDMRRAQELIDAAIKDLRDTTGTASLALAAALDKGAAIAQRNGRLDLSIARLEEAERLARGDSLDAIRIRDGLNNTRWNTLRDAGQGAEALVVAQASLGDAEAAPDTERDALRHRALHRVGVSMKDVGRFEASESAFRESLRLARALYGDDDYRTLRSRQSMGWMLIGRGEPARALSELEPVGERFRELFGERSQDYGTNLYNRALAYRALGQNQRAYDSFRAAADAYAASASAGAAQIGWALWNASGILSEQGDHAGARRLLDEIEDNWRDSIAEDARVRGAFYASITENRLALRELAEAEKYADRAHSLLLRLDGESAEVAQALVLTARVAAARRDAPRALSRYREAIAMIERIAPARLDLLELWREQVQILSTTAPAT
ncbi:MAG TPA: serine/threonine-protein kinase [Patescibacteria group bacterium]|nr:serine/threonine-protein kinase [Patescibacteria group bacterium]